MEFLYSFNPNIIKEKLNSLSLTIFFEQNVFMKQYNLLNYRISHPELLFPDLFATYTLETIEKANKCKILESFFQYYFNGPAISPKYKLSEAIRELFDFSKKSGKVEKPSENSPQTKITQHFLPDSFLTDSMRDVNNDISFIYDYFCCSTFPSLFGHFACSECSKAGFSFIKTHIKDPLAPKLVSQYLIHCTQFQDRIISQFSTLFLTQIDFPESLKKYYIEEDELQNSKLSDFIAKDDIGLLAKNLIDIFFEAFENCITYFDKEHFEIVKCLRESDENAANIAVCNFLRGIFSIWKFSPLFSENQSFNRIQSESRPRVFSLIQKTSLLDTMGEMIIHSEVKSKKVLDLFQKYSDIYTKLPSLHDMNQNEPYFFMTKADSFIICSLYKAIENEVKEEIKPCTKITDFDDFMNKMFILYNDDFYTIKLIVQKEKPNNISEEQSQDTSSLQKNKEDHLTIINQSKEIKHFHMNCKSAKHILKLKEKQYANSINSKNNILSLLRLKSIDPSFDYTPINYEVHILSSLVYSAITGYIDVQNETESFYKLFPDLKILFKNIRIFISKCFHEDSDSSISLSKSYGSCISLKSNELPKSTNSNEFKSTNLLAASDSPKKSHPIKQITLSNASKATSLSNFAQISEPGSNDSIKLVNREDLSSVIYYAFSEYCFLKNVDCKFFVNNAKYIIEEIERICFEFCLVKLNETPHNFFNEVDTSDSILYQLNSKNNMQQIAASFLEKNSEIIQVKRDHSKDELFESTKPGMKKNRKSDSSDLNPSMIPLIQLINLADIKMTSDSNLLIDNYFIGQQLDFFLLIKKLICNSATKDGNNKVAIIEKIGNYFFVRLRVNLITAIDFFTHYLNENKIMFPRIAKKVLSNLEYLRNAFHRKPKIDST